MVPIPNPQQQPPASEVIKRLRRQYEGRRLDNIKKLREFISKTASDETNHVKSIFLPPKDNRLNVQVMPDDEDDKDF
jgi:hypothetical protein